MEIKIAKIIRSRRRTIELQICSDASLIVRAPLKVSENYINKLVYKKRLWILRKQQFMRQQKQLVKRKKFINGEKFLYLGNTCKLHIVDNAKIPLALEKYAEPVQESFWDAGKERNVFLLSQKYVDTAREIFIRWYKEQAKQKITERVDFYCSREGLQYSKIKITDAQSRWGSCGGKNSLNFNWRLVMAPLEVIDYVVIHEIAHFSEKNHSKRFWTKVEKIMPEYKIHRKWLKGKKGLLML